MSTILRKYAELDWNKNKGSKNQVSSFTKGSSTVLRGKQELPYRVKRARILGDSMP